MIIPTSARRGFGAVAAALMLAGCTIGSQTSLAPLGAGGAARVAHPDRGRSWMAPDAKRKDLLYVSDLGTDDVDVFTYPAGALEGTLTGFNSPVGLCSDKSGNVWIVNAGAAQLVEYAHGGSSPIATLDDSGAYPQGCAVDPTTGNLAVGNFYGTPSNGPGNVAVYLGAQGSPTIYTDAKIANEEYCGYDDKGNLFVDGYTGGVGSVYAELPSGSNTFRNLKLNQHLGNAVGIQWHGKYLAINDSYANVIYQFKIHRNKGTEVGSTPLTDGNTVFQFWIQGGKVVGPNADYSSPSVMIWKYPAGGSPVKTITGLSFPVGSTVSIGQ